MTVHDDPHPESDVEDQGLFSLNKSVSSRAYIADIWKRRDFALSLPIEELQSQHLDTFLGNVWHLFDPVISAGIYFLVFGVFLGVGAEVDNFALWLVIGIFAYDLTASTISGGAKSIAGRQGLMRSFRFPRAIVPISNAMGHLLSCGFQFLVIIACTFASGIGPSRRWLLLPVIVLIHSAFNLGGSFIAARLNDSFRDMQEIVPFVLRLMRYTTGVMFPIETFFGKNALIDFVVRANPLVQLINFYRWVLIGTDLNIGLSALALIESFAILWFGFRFFRVAEYKYGKA